MRYKVKAFTLAELITTLAITGILAVAAIRAVASLHRLSGDYVQNTGIALEALNLQCLLQRDLMLSEETQSLSGGLTCSYPDHTVIYTFGEHETSREIRSDGASLIQSFALPLRATETSLNGQPVYTGIFEKLVCQTPLTGPSQKLVFRKMISSQEYLTQYAGQD